MRVLVLPADRRDQKIRGGAALGGDGLAHRGQARAHPGHLGQVVETGHGHVLGHGQTQVTQGVDGTDGQDVRHHRQGGGALFGAAVDEQFSACAVAVHAGARYLAEGHVLPCQAGLEEGLGDTAHAPGQGAVVAVLGHIRTGLQGQDRDTAMTELGEMLDDVVGATTIVHAHVGHVGRWMAVDQDEGHGTAT